MPGADNKRDIEDFPDECPECHGKPKRDEVGDLVCDKCGLVLENAIDTGRGYWSVDSDNASRLREGPPASIMRHDKNLPTEIGYDKRDAMGNRFPSREVSSIERMRKMNKRIRIANSRERNLAYALLEMDKVASHVSVSKNIKERAAVLYRECLDKGLMKGRTIEGLVGACLYASCRLYGVPRTLDEIVKYIPRTGRKELGRMYRLVSRELNLEYKPPNPSDYIERFSSSLGLESIVISKAREIIILAEEKQLLSGRVPTGLTAAAIYAACVICHVEKTQREISEVCGVTEVTIRNRFREMVDELGMPELANARNR
jgi:transcription initiation factor TFIIB